MNFTSNVPAGTEVVSVFPFKSSSSPGTIYECRLYSNRTCSCTCPGWTRRVDPSGGRSCKHTKEVLATKADRLLGDDIINGSPAPAKRPTSASPIQRPSSPAAHFAPRGRKFNFDA